jgi:hypothetical protein
MVVSVSKVSFSDRVLAECTVEKFDTSIAALRESADKPVAVLDILSDFKESRLKKEGRKLVFR